MSKEGSVAPKERVNIVYKPSTGNAQEEVELPLRILMVGDYTNREDGTPVEERKPINVDKDNFNDVLASQNLKLDLAVKDKLSDGGGSMAVSLSFKSIKDFGPEGIVNQVPELRKLLELRQALVALKGPLGNIKSFRKAIEDKLGNEEQRKRLEAELGLGDSK
jgi:type VI secretion system protein ImpB